MLWRWSEISALADEAARLTTTDVVERRVLSLVDPAYPENGSASTRNLNGGLQILLPGERARAHRHSMNAIRFVLEGGGATTIVDGKRCAMERGDLILTPAWTWHEHVHEGRERIVWLDVLDAQLHRFLETDAFEPGPPHDVVPPPAGETFAYPWNRALAELAATRPGPDGLRRMRYVGRAGGAVTAFLDCALWEIPAGRATVPASTTAHQLCTVVEGRGSTRVGDAAIAWEPRDVFSLPAGKAASHTVDDGPARIFVVSDREALRRLDLLVERVHGGDS